MFSVALWSVGSSSSEVRRVSPLIEEYIKRSGRFAGASAREFATETLFRAAVQKLDHVQLILLDSRGATWSSEEFAARIKLARDNGVRHVVLACGPPDGWAVETRGLATATFSFGRITLPHHLAQVVAAEQLYRALTILANHPYHAGH